MNGDDDHLIKLSDPSNYKGVPLILLLDSNPRRALQCQHHDQWASLTTAIIMTFEPILSSIMITNIVLSF